MRWHPDPEDRAAWSTAGGVLTAVGAAAVTGWLTASQEPLWPVFAFAALVLIGLYGMVAPLMRWPPWRSRPGSASRAAPPTQLPQAIHVLPTSHYAAGRLAAEAGMDPLERWLKGRIEEAQRHRRERAVLGTRAWQKAMHEWEVQNVTELAADYPSLVRDYQGDPPGHRRGLENEEAFYERQINWLQTTLQRLLARVEPDRATHRPVEAPRPVDLLREQHRKGRALQRRLVWAGGIPETPEQQGDADARARVEARRWGEEARRVIASHFPEYEREFFGDGELALGSTGFAMASEQEMKRSGGADDYLERRLAIIERLIQRERS